LYKYLKNDERKFFIRVEIGSYNKEKPHKDGPHIIEDKEYKDYPEEIFHYGIYMIKE
jgi:hypothetical protein